MRAVAIATSVKGRRSVSHHSPRQRAAGARCSRQTSSTERPASIRSSTIRSAVSVVSSQKRRGKGGGHRGLLAAGLRLLGELPRAGCVDHPRHGLCREVRQATRRKRRCGGAMCIELMDHPALYPGGFVVHGHGRSPSVVCRRGAYPTLTLACCVWHCIPNGVSIKIDNCFFSVAPIKSAKAGGERAEEFLPCLVGIRPGHTPNRISDSPHDAPCADDPECQFNWTLHAGGGRAGPLRQDVRREARGGGRRARCGSCPGWRRPRTGDPRPGLVHALTDQAPEEPGHDGLNPQGGGDHGKGRRACDDAWVQITPSRLPPDHDGPDGGRDAREHENAADLAGAVDRDLLRHSLEPRRDGQETRLHRMKPRERVEADKLTPTPVEILSSV